MAGKVRGIVASLAVFAAAGAASAAPTANAEPGPGSGETFFVDYLTRVFTPPTTEAAARAIIPLAQLVCQAKERQESDLQAANLVVAGNGVATLGMSTGSSTGDEPTALNVVNAATLAYCPQYNTALTNETSVE